MWETGFFAFGPRAQRGGRYHSNVLIEYEARDLTGRCVGGKQSISRTGGNVHHTQRFWMRGEMSFSLNVKQLKTMFAVSLMCLVFMDDRCCRLLLCFFFNLKTLNIDRSGVEWSETEETRSLKGRMTNLI